MAFKFNFGLPDDGSQAGERINISEIADKPVITDDGTEIKPIEIIIINDDIHYEIVKTCKPYQINLTDDLKLLSIKPSEAEKCCKDSPFISEAIHSHSDLIAGKYEGGLKIWEGSLDLCHYLVKNEVEFKSKTVLELGCGAGLPGICALKKGASAVHFQDFNSDVLEIMTIPNTILNTPVDDRSLLPNICKFYAGDWVSLLNFLTKEQDAKYDVILTSETIYNPQYHNHLYNIMKSLLKPNGTIYVAAKSYYFGLGGSVHQFTQLINKDGFFDLSTVWSTEGGLERVVIQLRPKTNGNK